MAPLLRRAAAADDRAFERLYRAHVRDVFRYSLAVLGEPADAEDVTQTTFLNAYRAFCRGERPRKPENWLITIAHNVCRQRFRQAQRRPQEVEFEDGIGDGRFHDEGEGPSAADLRRAFAALPANQRAALVMRELEGRSYADIAEVLEISVSALETLLFRARRALREQLEEQLSCDEAAFSISRQLDGRLDAAGKRTLRAHLRACPECARLAQSQRAQRRTLRGILAVPLPAALQAFSGFGGAAASSSAASVGSAALGGSLPLLTKAAAVIAAGAVVGGGAVEGAKHVEPLVHHDRLPATRPAAAKPAAPARLEATLPKPAPLPVPVAAPARGQTPGHVSKRHDVLVLRSTHDHGQLGEHRDGRGQAPGQVRKDEHAPPSAPPVVLAARSGHEDGGSGRGAGRGQAPGQVRKSGDASVSASAPARTVTLGPRNGHGSGGLARGSDRGQANGHQRRSSGRREGWGQSPGHGGSGHGGAADTAPESSSNAATGGSTNGSRSDGRSSAPHGPPAGR